MSRLGRRATPPAAPLTIGPTRVRLTPDDPLDAAWSALGSVYDPELCIDVVSLGLVYDVREEAGTVVIEMTLTTPGCPASESLPEMARAAVADALHGGGGVDVRVVWDPPWSPAMMCDDAAGVLGFRSR
jgi:metal-sulfur cluster biosynthetic enzyme